MALLSEVLSYRRTILGIIAFITLLSLLRLHEDTTLFIDRLYNRPDRTQAAKDAPAKLDSTYKGVKTSKSEKPTLDIVVSMYKEPLNETRHMLDELRSLEPFSNLTITTYVYTKDKDADVDLIREELNATHVLKLDNVGREAGTYFTHVLNQWDNLARHTAFMQAEPHQFDGAVNRIKEWFLPQTGVLSLGQVESCDCVSCTDKWDTARTFPRIEELYSALNGEFCPPRIALSYLGQIIASATRIRSRGPSTYKYLKQVLESDMEHFIHADPREGFFQDESSNPYFGHTIERSYMVLWNCADEALVERCGGFEGLYGRREEGMPDDYCQCVDPAAR